MRLAIVLAVFTASFAAAAPAHVDTVPDSHIVLLKPTANAAQLQSWVAGKIAGNNKRVVFDKWDTTPSFRGFSGQFDAELVNEMKTRPEVAGVYPNMIHNIVATQTNAPSWGLPRISSPTPGTKDYSYPDGAGAGVTAYIIDTGIRTTHKEFEGRARWLWSADGKNQDDHGHGSHVAGTVGGTTYGVAKKVDLVAIKVCNSQGQCTSADIIKGVNQAIADAKGKKAVANMSLGGGVDPTIDAAVKAGIDSGIAFALAAGNSKQDACTSSPARVPEAVTVAALEKTDNQASYSNWGKCVDLYAPGSAILSAWFTDDNASNTISGTSMASPHAAGVLALLSSAGKFSPAELSAKIVQIATKGAVKGASAGTPNLILNNGFAADGTDPAPTSTPTKPAPTSAPTSAPSKPTPTSAPTTTPTKPKPTSAPTSAPTDAPADPDCSWWQKFFGLC